MISGQIETCVQLIAETAVAEREAWNALDAAVADGDLGTSLARGFQAVLDAWAELDRTDVGHFLGAVADVFAARTGGSSGPLFAAALRGAGAAAGARTDVDIPTCAAMLDAATAAISALGGAGVGDKTALDALVPLAEAVRATTTSTRAAATAAAAGAVAGASSTIGMRPRRGRATYAADRVAAFVDPGAAAIAVMAGAVAAHLGATTPALPWVAESSAGRAEGATNRRYLTKKFVDDIDDAPWAALRGYARSVPDLVRWDDARRIIVRTSTSDSPTVGVISGGGSGHEPLHAGYVGRGMLTAAAPGAVFASPTAGQVVAATQAADSGAGVLHIVKNYTGDVLNFRQAAESARDQGITVATVLVDEDIAVTDSTHTVGRRGTAATVLVEKIAGAASERGSDLATVAALAQRAVDNSATLGIALTSCSPPGAAPILDLGPDEVEVGVGIHGEPGRYRGRLRPAEEIVGEFSELLVAHLELEAGARVITLVNGFGGTPLMELYLLFDDLLRALARRDIRVERNLVGTYVTSLEMAGASITLLELDEELLELWDAPVTTAALRW